MPNAMRNAIAGARTMNARIMLLLTGLLSLGTAFGDNPEYQILASFDRELNYQPAQPAPRRPIERESVSADPLYKRLNAARWTNMAKVNPVLNSILSPRTVTLLETCDESSWEHKADPCYAATMSIRTDFRTRAELRKNSRTILARRDG